MSRFRLLLADDHLMLRDGLRCLFQGEPDMEVIGDAADGRQAVALAVRLKPDVVLMDVSLPDLDGMEATRQITAQLPGVKVLAFSAHCERPYVTRMFEAGACGYLSKNCRYEELLQAIRTVAANERYVSPRIVRELGEDYLSELPATAPTSVEPSPRSRSPR